MSDSDPVGLDAAIEAAVPVYSETVQAAFAVDTTDPAKVKRLGIAAAVRAAAPHLVRGERRAALLEAADDLAAQLKSRPISRDTYAAGLLLAEQRLRERAEREAT